MPLDIANAEPAYQAELKARRETNAAAKEVETRIATKRNVPPRDFPGAEKTAANDPFQTTRIFQFGKKLAARKAVYQAASATLAEVRDNYGKAKAAVNDFLAGGGAEIGTLKNKLNAINENVAAIVQKPIFEGRDLVRLANDAALENGENAPKISPRDFAVETNDITVENAATLNDRINEKDKLAGEIDERLYKRIDENLKLSNKYIDLLKEKYFGPEEAKLEAETLAARIVGDSKTASLAQANAQKEEYMRLAATESGANE